MATSTIGTASRDYSTMSSWEAALGTGSQTGQCYDDSEFDETVTINDSDPSDITFEPASGEGHDGTAGTGVRLVLTAGRQFDVSTSSNAVTARQIERDHNGNELSGGGTGLSDEGINASRFLIHGGTSGENIQVRGLICSSYGSTTPVRSNHNHVIYDHAQNRNASNANINGCEFTPDSRASQALNITVQNITTTYVSTVAAGFNSDYSNNHYKNLIATSCDTHCFYSMAGSGTDYLIADDNTDIGANSIGADDGVTESNLFVSTVVGSEDLNLKSGADAIGIGYDGSAVISGSEVDASGYDRTGDTWDIGAFQFQAAGGAAFPFHRYYAGMGCSL